MKRRDFLKSTSQVATGLIAGNSFAQNAWALPDSRGFELDYLRGAYEPVRKELTDAVATVLSGAIPKNLNGRFLQISTNPQFPESFKKYHWFDGDGMFHVVKVEGAKGEARFSNRFVRTEKFLKERAAGKSLSSGVLDLSPIEALSYFSKGTALGENASNTAFMNFDGRVFSLWWMGGDPYEIDVENLQTVGRTNFDGALKKGFPAHPKVDPVTGELIFFTHVLSEKVLNIGIMSPGRENVRYKSVRLNDFTFFHDMGITENYVIVPICPTVVGLRTKGELKFIEDRPTTFLVLDRRTMEIQYFFASPCFVSHIANSWEQDGVLRVVGARAPHPTTPLEKLSKHLAKPISQIPHNGGTNFVAQFHEWSFDLSKPQSYAVEKSFDSRWREFPTVDPKLLGRPTRFAFMGQLKNQSLLAIDTIVKQDMMAKTNADDQSQMFSLPDGAIGGEMQFVGNEGDGHLIQMIYDNSQGQSETWIYDAGDITRGPVCRLGLPGRVTPGAHTHWISRASASGYGTGEDRS